MNPLSVPFAKRFYARLRASAYAEKQEAASGAGDIEWCADLEILRLAQASGTGWNEYDLGNMANQEQIEDIVGGLIVAGTNIDVTYSDEAGTLTIDNTASGEAEDISCRIYKTTTAQTIATTGNANITFNAELFDTDTMHDNSTNSERITVKTVGKYIFGASFVFDLAGSETGSYIIRLYHHTTAGDQLVAALSFDRTNAHESAVDFYASIVGFIYANASVDDYFFVNVWNKTGGDCVINASESTCFWARRI